MSDEALDIVKREITPVWQRIDEERRERRELEQAHGETRGKVKVLNQRLDNFVASFNEHREESRRGTEKLFQEIHSLREEIRGNAAARGQNEGQQQGKTLAKREMAAWGTAAGSLLAVAAMVVQLVN